MYCRHCHHCHKCILTSRYFPVRCNTPHRITFGLSLCQCRAKTAAYNYFVQLLRMTAAYDCCVQLLRMTAAYKYPLLCMPLSVVTFALFRWIFWFHIFWVAYTAGDPAPINSQLSVPYPPHLPISHTYLPISHTYYQIPNDRYLMTDT